MPAPSTPTETALAEVWRDLLGAQREIGITENFFEAGGNSLVAMQILYRVETRLNCRLDIADVFSYQTIQLLVRFIDAFTDTQVLEEEEVEELSYRSTDRESGTGFYPSRCDALAAYAASVRKRENVGRGR